MHPATTKVISSRSCLRHARSALTAADYAVDPRIKATLMEEHDAWIVRHQLTIGLTPPL